MASKNRNSAQIKRLKLHNNATSKLPLRCQVPHCEEDFYVRYIVNNKWARRCHFHYENPPQVNSNTGQTQTRNLLTKLCTS